MRKNRFVQNLRHLAGRRKWQDLADDLGIPYGSLATYVSGRNSISVERLAHIADFFNVTMDDLMFGGLESGPSYVGDPGMELGNIEWVRLAPGQSEHETVRMLMLPGIPRTKERLLLTECVWAGMEPKVNVGDLIIGFRVREPLNFGTVLVVTEQEIFFGRMKMNDADEFVLLHESPSHPTQTLLWSECLAVYRINYAFKQERL